MRMRHIDQLSQKDIASLENVSKYPLSVFGLLGYVCNFYGGGFNSDKGIIDTVYVYNSTEKDEPLKIEQLEKICRQVINDIGIENDIIITNKNDSLNSEKKYTLSSQNICNYLLSIEFDNILSLFVPLFKSPIGLFPLALLQRLEFLVGSYINHQTNIESEWRFANNIDKMRIVFDFLLVFANEGDDIQTNTVYKTPMSSVLKINSNSEIWNAIKNRI